jgi:manganese/iron transport system substrate-binding protein
MVTVPELYGFSTLNLPSRVTTHDALGYYASAYSIPVEGALQGISTEEKPTAVRVKALVDAIAQAQVPTIFTESERELFSDSLGELGSEGETYPKMLIANTQTIVEGLGGKFTPFSTQFPVNKKK